VPVKKKTLNATLKKVLTDFGGPEAVNICKILAVADDETTDEQIAEMAKVRLNIVRKILYILSENKLARFRRVRDKRSGWFVFYWQESFDKLLDVIKERRQMVIEKLEARLYFEDENYFFLCSEGCEERFIFIEAMEYNFQCPKCGKGTLSEDRNDKKVTFLKNSISELRDQA
jgi:transcription initiation factor TFIIE subunit alpha